MSELITQYERLVSNGPINLATFLSSFPNATGDERKQVVLTEHGRRWAAKDPLLMEELLEQLPWLATDENALLALALAEFKQQLNANRNPTHQEFLDRFPSIVVPLEELLAKLEIESGDRATSRGTCDPKVNCSKPQVIKITLTSSTNFCESWTAIYV